MKAIDKNTIVAIRKTPKEKDGNVGNAQTEPLVFPPVLVCVIYGVVRGFGLSLR